MNKQNGLTLIEIVVYLSIVGIILLIAIPSYKVIGEAAFNADSRKLLTDIRYVKDLIILKGSKHKIVFNKDGYKIVNDKNEIIKKHAFRYGTYLKDYKLSKGRKKVNYMSYNLSGNASVSGSLILSNANKSKRISIVPVTGRVLLTEP